MAWVRYNEKEHGAVKKYAIRVVTWDDLRTIATKKSDSQVSIGTYRINQSAVAKLRPGQITKDYYIGDDGNVKMRGFDGWSTFTLPLSCIEIYMPEKPKNIDYFKSTFQRCSKDTLICSRDKVRVLTRTEMIDGAFAKGSQGKTLKITDHNRSIHDTEGRMVSTLTKGSWKKLRSGDTVYCSDIDYKQKKVKLRSTYGEVLWIPFEYLEICPNVATTQAQRNEAYGIKTQVQTLKQKLNKPQPTETKKETIMEAKFNAQQIMDQNKDALLVAAKIEVGEAAVRQVSKIIKGQLPIMVRGYAELPVFDILVANMVVMAIKQFAPENEKANVIADAMLLAAMQKQMKEFNIPGMIEDFVSGIDVTAITKLESKSV